MPQSPQSFRLSARLPHAHTPEADRAEYQTTYTLYDTIQERRKENRYADAVRPAEQALDIYRRLRAVHANLRLILVPRQKDRFEEVASLLKGSGLPFIRRSALTAPVADRTPIVLVDKCHSRI